MELRVALTTQAFDRLADFYRVGLGMEPAQVWPAEQGRALVLDMGKATLEVFDEKQATTIDQTEVGPGESAGRSDLRCECRTWMRQ